MQSRQPLIGCTTYRKTSMDTEAPLFGIVPAYIEVVSAAGGIPVMIPLGQSEEALLTVLARLDGLLLPGGGDIDPAFYDGVWHHRLRDIDEDRDRVEIFLARAAAETKKPFLAICRGHQVLNVALGGTMWEDIASQMPNPIKHDYFQQGSRSYLAHMVEVLPNSWLAEIFGPGETAVNSLHHQGIRDLAPALTTTAVAPDGLIEGVEIEGHPFGIGVQWHPECITHNAPVMQQLFSAFVKAAEANST